MGKDCEEHQMQLPQEEKQLQADTYSESQQLEIEIQTAIEQLQTENQILEIEIQTAIEQLQTAVRSENQQLEIQMQTAVEQIKTHLLSENLLRTTELRLKIKIVLRQMLSEIDLEMILLQSSIKQLLTQALSKNQQQETEIRSEMELLHMHMLSEIEQLLRLVLSETKQLATQVSVLLENQPPQMEEKQPVETATGIQVMECEHAANREIQRHYMQEQLRFTGVSSSYCETERQKFSSLETETVQQEQQLSSASSVTLQYTQGTCVCLGEGWSENNYGFRGGTDHVLQSEMGETTEDQSLTYVKSFLKSEAGAANSTVRSGPSADIALMQQSETCMGAELELASPPHGVEPVEEHVMYRSRVAPVIPLHPVTQLSFANESIPGTQDNMTGIHDTVSLPKPVSLSVSQDSHNADLDNIVQSRYNSSLLDTELPLHTGRAPGVIYDSHPDSTCLFQPCIGSFQSEPFSFRICPTVFINTNDVQFDLSDQMSPVQGEGDRIHLRGENVLAEGNRSLTYSAPSEPESSPFLQDLFMHPSSLGNELPAPVMTSELLGRNCRENQTFNTINTISVQHSDHQGSPKNPDLDKQNERKQQSAEVSHSSQNLPETDVLHPVEMSCGQNSGQRHAPRNRTTRPRRCMSSDLMQNVLNERLTPVENGATQQQSQCQRGTVETELQLQLNAATHARLSQLEFRVSRMEEQGPRNWSRDLFSMPPEYHQMPIATRQRMENEHVVTEHVEQDLGETENVTVCNASDSDSTSTSTLSPGSEEENNTEF